MKTNKSTQKGTQSSSSAGSGSPLVNLPRDMLQLISEYLGPQAVGNLRKTCGSLANNEFLIERQLNLAKPMIVAGYYHTQALAADGRVYSWGKNNNGRLGLGHNDDQNTPRLVPDFVVGGSKIISIAGGASHTLALTADGKLYAWGGNYCGQLGLGHNNDQNTPRLVPDFVVGGSKIISIAAGSDHSLALTADGKLYAWGGNYCGQLGLGNNVDQNTPRLVSNLVGSRIISIAIGDGHSLALDADGKLYAWGANSSGQLGLGHNNDQNTPRLVPDFVVGGSKIISIAAGSDHSLALTADGKLYAWGDNSRGQLGLGSRVEQNTPRMVGINIAPGLNLLRQRLDKLRQESTTAQR